jgi:hypothetical protein
MSSIRERYLELPTPAYVYRYWLSRTSRSASRAPCALRAVREIASSPYGWPTDMHITMCREGEVNSGSIRSSFTFAHVCREANSKAAWTSAATFRRKALLRRDTSHYGIDPDSWIACDVKANDRQIIRPAYDAPSVAVGQSVGRRKKMCVCLKRENYDYCRMLLSDEGRIPYAVYIETRK